MTTFLDSFQIIYQYDIYYYLFLNLTWQQKLARNIYIYYNIINNFALT